MAIFDDFREINRRTNEISRHILAPDGKFSKPVKVPVYTKCTGCNGTGKVYMGINCQSCAGVGQILVP